MWRLRATWSGPPVVGGGVSTFYALDTSPGFPAAVRALLNAAAGSIQAGVTITIPNNGDVIDASTGALTGAWTDGAAPAPIVCTDAGTYAAGVGAQWRWRTSGIVAGRRVTGSTFLVPLGANTYDGDGNIGSVQLTAFNAAAAAYITAAPYAVIWSRPRPGRAGSSHLITSGSMPDRVSWLRSRRT